MPNEVIVQSEVEGEEFGDKRDLDSDEPRLSEVKRERETGDPESLGTQQSNVVGVSSKNKTASKASSSAKGTFTNSE